MSEAVLDSTTYYRATANREFKGAAAAQLPGRVDACVIGAGFTGLSAALELAAAGRSVAVFDTGPVGWGASGRNGGQVCTGFSPGMAGFEKQLGAADARLCFDVSEEAKRLMTSRIGKYGIDCDLTWGFLHAAARPSHIAHLQEHADELERYGVSGLAMLSREELAAKVGSKAYHGALRESDAGHIHTLNYCLGLAHAVQQEGGMIFENTAVTAVQDGTPVRLSLAGGREIACDQVIVACNAYLGTLIPGLNHRVMPVASYVITTEGLGDDRARNLIRDREAVTDSNFVVDYMRLTADNRLLFGGRCSYSGIHPKDLAANMRPRMLRIFPQLEDAAVEFAWGGHIGITYNRLPDVGRQGRSIYYAHGYSGQGLILAGMLGKLLAEAVLGDQTRFDVFSRIRHLPFPGGVLRRPALTLGMLYYRLRDILS